MAVEIIDESESIAVGKTLGRVALTGVGSALLFGGKHAGRTGLGSGLLDLSYRGAAHKTSWTGNLIWPDTTVVTFEADRINLENLTKVLPSSVSSQEALVQAAGTLELVARMKSDGIRVLDELRNEDEALKAESGAAQSGANEGATFAERDSFRRKLLAYEARRKEIRHVELALMAEFQVNVDRQLKYTQRDLKLVRTVSSDLNEGDAANSINKNHADENSINNKIIPGELFYNINNIMSKSLIARLALIILLLFVLILMWSKNKQADVTSSLPILITPPVAFANVGSASSVTTHSVRTERLPALATSIIGPVNASKDGPTRGTAEAPFPGFRQTPKLTAPLVLQSVLSVPPQIMRGADGTDPGSAARY